LKRILYITARADYGGGPEHLYTLAKSLKDEYSLYIACPHDIPYWDEYVALLSESRICEIPHRIFSFLNLIKLILFIRTNKIIIIHSHGKGAGIYSRLLKLCLPYLKVIHTFHGIYYKDKIIFSKRLHLYVEQLFSHFTDFFICVSKGEMADAVSLKICAANRTIVIYNGIEIPTRQDTIDLDPSYLDISKDHFIVLHISRFDYFKNVSLLIDIAEQVGSCDSSIIFLLIGDGPEKSTLEKLASSKRIANIFFLGFQSRASRFFSISSLYLSTSRKEGLPLSLIESLSMGNPIVATDIPGNDEIVKHGYNGFLFPLNNPKAAGDYILELKNDPLKLKSLSEGAINSFNAIFCLKTMLNEYRKIYQGVDV